MRIAPASQINAMTDYPLRSGASTKGSSMTSKLLKSEQLHLSIKRQDEVVSTRSGEYAISKNIQRCNQRIQEGMETLEEKEVEMKKQEEEQFKKTLITPYMISIASQNIKKLNANLKHHVLSSEYCEDDDPGRSKYIDLVEGASYDC